MAVHTEERDDVARTGGGDLSGNPTLFDAVQKAKKSSVLNDNIDRAVKRGAGLEAGNSVQLEASATACGAKVRLARESPTR